MFSGDKQATNNADETAKKASDSENAKPAFAVDIANIALKKWKLNAQDHSFTNPLQLNIADINVDFAVINPAGDWEIRGLNTKLNQIALKSSLFNKPVATIQNVHLSQGDILLKPQQVSAQSVLLSGLKTELIHAPNAPLNWQRILATSSKGQKSSNNKTSQPEWKFALKKLALADSKLHIEDQSPSGPVVLDIQ